MQVPDRRVKELKVAIPTELHLQLLRMKILHGQTIATSVEEALRAYFTEVDLQAEMSSNPSTSGKRIV